MSQQQELVINQPLLRAYVVRLPQPTLHFRVKIFFGVNAKLMTDEVGRVFFDFYEPWYIEPVSEINAAE